MTESSLDNNAIMRRGIVKRIVQIIFTIVLMGIILFGASGDLTWGWAWLYLGVYALGVLVNGVIMFRTNPELIAERGEPKEGVKEWDKRLTRFAAPLWFFIFLVAGLDHRFGWTPPFPLWVHLIGFLLYLAGNTITLWAINTNTFFSTSVRIQEDRGHYVVDIGPYAIIRHPGYTGMGLHMTGIPFMMGSLWALIPAIAMDISMAVRTQLEDQTLQSELDGYMEYATRVPYRLIPGVW